jgi:ribosomal protein S18 acetylase RimI-like enzyme
VPGAPRIGWIEYLGTREDQQRRGLGRAALLAGLGQLHAWGAQRAALITMPTNDPANALYAATGFTRSKYEDVYSWRPVTA